MPALPVEYLKVEIFSTWEVAARGEPCTGAHEHSNCLEKLADSGYELEHRLVDRAFTGASPGMSCLLTATRGDEVLLVDTEPALRRFLEPIDTLKEAELLVACHTPKAGPDKWLIGDYHLDCDRSGGVENAEGFDVLAYRSGRHEAFGPRWIRVTKAGTLSVRSTKSEAEPGAAME